MRVDRGGGGPPRSWQATGFYSGWDGDPPKVLNRAKQNLTLVLKGSL